LKPFPAGRYPVGANAEAPLRALSIAILSILAAPAMATEPGAPRPHVDLEAMQEARGEGRMASSRAILHYLEARRCEEQGDWACAAAELDLAATYDDRSPDLRAALAEALALGGQAARAEAEARRAVELSGGAGLAAAHAHLLLGQLAAGRDREEAVLELRQAVRLQAEEASSGGTTDPEPWRVLAVLYLELGDEQAAGRTLDDLSARAPGESGAFRESGRWLLERHRPGSAEGYLRRAVQAARDDVQAWRLLARAHAELGREPEVKEDLEAILEVQPDDPDALYWLGSAALRADDADGARSLFQRHERSASDRVEAAIRVANLWLEAGHPGDALEGVREAEDEVGPDPRLKLLEGVALERLRRWTEAARVLRGVGEDAGDTFVPARAALAEVLARSGRFAEAGRVLALPLEQQPGDVRLVTAQAFVLERAGRAREAAAVLARAAAANEAAGEADDAAALWAARAEVKCRAGRAREAVAALQPKVAARPGSAPLRLALAASLEAAGSPEAAAAELRALLVLEPETPEALARLAFLLLASSPPQLDEADELARRAAEQRPRSPEALDAVGRVRSLRGDHAGAIAALERAAALSGGAERYLEDLGDAYRAAGRPRDAAAAWRRALASAADEVPSVAERMRTGVRRKLRAAGHAVAEQGASTGRRFP